MFFLKNFTEVRQRRTFGMRSASRQHLFKAVLKMPLKSVFIVWQPCTNLIHYLQLNQWWNEVLITKWLHCLFNYSPLSWTQSLCISAVKRLTAGSISFSEFLYQSSTKKNLDFLPGFNHIFVYCAVLTLTLTVPEHRTLPQERLMSGFEMIVILWVVEGSVSSVKCGEKMKPGGNYSTDMWGMEASSKIKDSSRTNIR